MLCRSFDLGGKDTQDPRHLNLEADAPLSNRYEAVNVLPEGVSGEGSLVSAPLIDRKSDPFSAHPLLSPFSAAIQALASFLNAKTMRNVDDDTLGHRETWQPILTRAGSHAGTRAMLKAEPSPSWG